MFLTLLKLQDLVTTDLNGQAQTYASAHLTNIEKRIQMVHSCKMYKTPEKVLVVTFMLSCFVLLFVIDQLSIQLNSTIVKSDNDYWCFPPQTPNHPTGTFKALPDDLGQ